jgi:LysM repeat protein
MAIEDHEPDNAARPSAWFATTHWTVVRLAGHSAQARAALAALSNSDKRFRTYPSSQYYFTQPPTLELEPHLRSAYVLYMKRFSLLVLGLALCAPPGAHAQDAATEERLNQLSGKIEDLIAGHEAQRKRIAELSKEVDSLRDQQSKPNANYAGHEDLKRLSDAIKEVDRKRIEDAEKTTAELRKLGKILSAPLPTPATNKIKPGPTQKEVTNSEKPPKTEDMAEYVVKSGDKLGLIVKAYNDKNIKVTVDQILKANPGLVPEKMHVGQKILVPLSQ